MQTFTFTINLNYTLLALALLYFALITIMLYFHTQHIYTVWIIQWLTGYIMFELLDITVSMFALFAIWWCWQVKQEGSKYHYLLHTNKYKVVNFLLDIYVIIIIIQFIFWLINQ